LQAAGQLSIYFAFPGQTVTVEKLMIEHAFKRHFVPMLRAGGFTGTGRTFRRTRAGQIHVVNIQSSSHGGQFAINLAIQPVAIPDVLGNKPDSKKILEKACEFRRRLSETGADQWWSYHDIASLDQALVDAAKVYEAHGSHKFDAMSLSPTPLDTMTAEQLSAERVELNGFGITKVRLALVLARLREAEGNISDAVSFAVYGCAHAINAFGLRSELERIAALGHNLPRRPS
jgi:hypothetical protein